MSDRPSTRFSRHLLPGASLALSLIVGCQDECPEPTICDVSERACQQEIMHAVSCLRGGDTALPPVTVLSESELAAKLGTGGEQTPEQQRSYELWNRGLALFDLAPPDYTLESSQEDWISNIAAVYFPGTKEIVVVDRGESLASEQAVTTFAHEVVHALQDADYDLGKLQEKWGTNYDASLALDGVIEGEAVLYQNLISLKLEGISPADIDWEGYFRDWRADSLLEGDLDDAPVAMADIRFPYAFGGGFVTQYYLEGKRAAVDSLIAAPPRSTGEIMFGPQEREPENEQNFWDHASPDLGDSFETISGSTLGAWITRMYAARVEVPIYARLEAAQHLLVDMFAVHANATTGQVVASWRIRLGGHADAETFPGLISMPLRSWTVGGSEAVLLAGDPAVTDPQGVAWIGFGDDEDEDEAVAAAASSTEEPAWRRRGARGCDPRSPSLMKYWTGQ